MPEQVATVGTADAPWLFIYGPPYNCDPLEWAESNLTHLFELHRTIPADRSTDPARWPTFGPDTSDGAFARRVLAALLDYGWQPPAVPQPTEESHDQPAH